MSKLLTQNAMLLKLRHPVTKTQRITQSQLNTLALSYEVVVKNPERL